MRTAVFLLWLRWAVWVTLFSITTAAMLSLGVSLYFYMAKGAALINSKVLDALLDIALFWFAIFWSMTLPLGTFFGMKQLFMSCSSSLKLQLFTCKKEPIQSVHYEDVIKVWRKWLFLIIWGVAAEVVVIMGIEYLLQRMSFLAWFNIYSLYLLVMTSSLATLFLLVRKCRLLELKPC